MPKISALPPVVSTLSANDVIPMVDDNDGSTKKVTLASILSFIYPIGSYYINETNGTNPATLLGFGTWVPAAVGRVPVGKAASGTFSTAGATMGTESETLSTAQIPSHTHDTNFYRVDSEASGWGLTGSSSFSGRVAINTTNGAHTDATGGGGSHNNIQPSIVVYIWKRTA